MSLSKPKPSFIESETPPPHVDQLVPDPIVWKEFGVTPLTLYRWTRDEALGFPPVIKINRKNFRSRRALEAFKHSEARNPKTAA